MKYQRKTLATRLLLQSLFIELIADSAEGQDPFGITIILFYRLAQAPDVDVNGARSDESFAAPYAIEELIAG